MISNAHHRTRRARANTRTLLGSLVAGVALPSAAMAGLSFTGTDLTENFDSLGPGATGHFSLTAGTQNTIPGLETWDGVKIAGNGTVNMNFVVNNGSSNSGAMYSYGAIDDTDRALGSLASGSNTPGFGVSITNNSAFDITSFSLSFTAEQWRSSTAVDNRLVFAYGVSGEGINENNYLTDAGMTLFAGLDAPAKSFVAASNGATDGNHLDFQTPVSSTISVTVPIGATLFLRWLDIDNPGNDAGIGIDDWTFSAVGGGKTLAWNPPGSNWNTDPGNTNWLEGGTPSAFADNDVVNFTDAGLAAGSTVTIDAGGVNPGNTTVSNTDGTYTFTGGSIGGSGVITKTGDGTLVLNNTNTNAGGVVLNGGRIVISDDAALGASNAVLTLGGGTLIAAANITGTRGINLSSSSESAIVDQGNTVTIGGSVGGSGAFVKEGSGTLVLNGTANLGGITRLVGGGTLVLGQPSGTALLRTSFDGGDFDGALVINNAIRVNLNEGVFGGSGNIYVKTSGAQISNTGAGLTNIDKEIVANADNVAGPFELIFGGVGGHEVNLNATISGNADLNFASSPLGGGAATINLNTALTYTGQTLFNHGGPTPATETVDGFPAGTIRLGLDNVFPVTTDVIANTITTANNGPGRIEMNGRNQTFSSIATGAGAGTGLFEITNFGGGNSTLTINGNTTPATPFAGILTDGPTNTLTLVKEGSGVLELTGVYPAIYTWKQGGAEVPIKPYSGGTYVRGGTLIAPNLTHGPLSITGGEARVSAKETPNDPVGTTVVPSLTFGGTVTSPVGKLDLTNNSLIIDFDGGPGLAGDIRQLIKAGIDSAGASGIVSSSATNSTGLGYGDNAVLNKTEFAGKTVDSDSTLIKFTYFGDSDLNGQVDVADLGALASNWQTAGVWTAGDFDYSGFIDVADLGLLASNWQAGVGSPLGPSFQEALVSVGLGGVTVPEPASIGLIGLLASWSLKRPRRC